MLRKLIIAGAMTIAATTAFAVDVNDVSKTIELKDGSTVYIFKNGKMGMEDKLGRAVRMKEGHPMETKDGQKIIMVGDEVARLDWILRKDKIGQ